MMKVQNNPEACKINGSSYKYSFSHYKVEILNQEVT